MRQIFICNDCNVIIDETVCKKCNQEICNNQNGIIDFVKHSKKIKKEDKISQLNVKIDSLGFTEGISQFIDENPSYKTKFNDEEIFQNGDGLFHCYQEDKENCLEIGSYMGSTCETLSHNFKKVFSLDQKIERLEFQKRKFEHNKRNNIILVRSDFEKLPFPDDYFDFIVCKELSNKFFPNDIHGKNMIKEIKRVLKPDGFFYFTLSNRRGFQIFSSKNKNSYRNSKQDDFTYEKCKKVIEDGGFKSKTYWSLPSYDTPLYSGSIEDPTAAVWFFKNLDKFLPKTKQISRKRQFVTSFLKFANSKLVGYFIRKYAPSYHFCCTLNGDFQKTVEFDLMKKTKANTFLTLSRRLKIIYFIFDENNNPKKIAIVRKFSYESLEDICYKKIKKYGGIFVDDERVSYENWKEGRMLDPTNHKEILDAIDWIFDFQNKTKKSQLTPTDIEREISDMNNYLPKYFSEHVFYEEWQKKYKKYLNDNLIFKTSIHNDLSFRNFLIDNKNNKISAIDWERYKEEGNPINDFIMFVYRTIISRNTDSIEILQEKLEGRNQQFNKIVKDIQRKFFEHYGFELDLLTIVRFQMLRSIVIKGNKGHDIKKELKIIELLKKSHTLQHQQEEISSN